MVKFTFYIDQHDLSQRSCKTESQVSDFRTSGPLVLLMTQIFKVCQIDHRFEHFGHLFMLLTIAAKDHKLNSDL